MNVSRQDIYSYVTTLLKSVSNNIYRIKRPEMLTTDVSSNGFIVLKMGGVKDFSELVLDTYAQTRVYVECYIPSMKTDKTINSTKYKTVQNAVDNIINAECLKSNQPYTISRDDMVLSTEDFFTNNTDSFFVYITSFLISIT